MSSNDAMDCILFGNIIVDKFIAKECVVLVW